MKKQLNKQFVECFQNPKNRKKRQEDKEAKQDAIKMIKDTLEDI